MILKIAACLVGAPIAIGALIYLTKVYAWIGSSWLGLATGPSGGTTNDALAFGTVTTLVSVMAMLMVFAFTGEDDEDED